LTGYIPFVVRSPYQIREEVLGLDIYVSEESTTVVANPQDMTEYFVGIHSDHSFPEGIT
jgi:hypothetical protein